MDVYEMRKQLRGHSIYELPLRVTFYARVSSETDEQLNSLDNQVSYYSSFIQSHASWQFVEGYVDEGISGISTRHRERFLEMIDDAKHDKFDMILTKEISRFARNTVDSIQYTRELLSQGVCVFFQNDNINTLDEDSELRLTIMSGIAQDELRKLSSRVKFGHQQAIKKGVVLGNSRIFGYTKEGKRLVIDEREAEMVRSVFEWYATGNYSMKAIENKLWDAGYRNHNGNKIAHTTLSNIIANPKYKGYYVGNKVRIVDLFTKKQKYLPQEDWVMYKDETGKIVPAIVSEALWERANAVLKQRSLDVKQRQNKCNHNNLLTGKLVCTHCGMPYYRKDSQYKGTKRSRWVCSGKIKKGADSCPSFAIDEAEIQHVLFDVFTQTKDSSSKYIDEYIRLFKQMVLPDNTAQIARLQAQIERAEHKRTKLLELYTDDAITKRDFQELNAQCVEEMQDAKCRLDEIHAQAQDEASIMHRLAAIKDRLLQAATEAKQHGTVPPAFINQYVQCIYAEPQGTTIHLTVKLFSGMQTDCELSRTGQIPKTICPVRTTTVYRSNWKFKRQMIALTYIVDISI